MFGIIFPARELGGRSVERRRRLPLSALCPPRRIIIRRAFAAMRRRARSALLGSHAAGILQARRRLAAGAGRREVLVVIQCEETRAIENLPKILKEVPGIGVVLIGEGDLSQELGHPRDYEHPVVAEEINRILAICKEHNVPCGHPHPDAHNIERLVASGYRFLMPSAPRSFGVLDQGRKLAGRN